MKEKPEIMTSRQAGILLGSLVTVGLVIVFILGVTTGHAKTTREKVAALIVLVLAIFIASSTVRVMRKR